MADVVGMQELASIDRCVRPVREFVVGDLDRLKRLGDFSDLCGELSVV